MDVEKLPMSKRLLMNAALVPKCGALAEIGCDHAYTCLYLVGKGVTARALAMDVNCGPLLRAKKNIECYGFADQIKTRLSDGLSELFCGEADCILISGMGGPLIIDILKKGWEKVLSAKYLVLQPQSEIGQVREFLHKMGYLVTAEDMCEEEGKFYAAMRAERSEVTETEDIKGRMAQTARARAAVSQQVAYRYGACLIAAKHPVLRKYMMREIAKKQELAQELARQQSGGAKRRLLEVKEELAQLFEVLDFLAE